MDRVNDILTRLAGQFPQASDFVINPEEIIVISSKRVIHKENGDFSQAIEDVLIEKGISEQTDVDTSWKADENLRFRLNIAKYDSYRYELTFRWLRDVQWRLEDYDIDEKIVSEIYNRVDKKKGGLFLVIGPTGSGKSTVMVTILNYLLENLPIRVISIEDPVEYRLKEGIGSVLQREVGSDTTDFNRALKSALRQNPNVIFVGEVRDRETVKLLFEAADTGHVVFATMHTDTPKDSIERLLGMVDVDEHDFIIRMIVKTLVGILGLRMYDYNGSKLMLYEYMNGQDSAVKGAIQQKAFASLSTFSRNIEKGHIPFEYALARKIKEKKTDAGDINIFGFDKSLVMSFMRKV